MNWQKAMERLSIPGLILLVLGAVAASQAGKYCKSERLCMIARIAGLVSALLGTVILLDFIPGM